MATTHNSFDASKLFARVRSPLAAFNDVRTLIVAIMVFQDEAKDTYVGNPALFALDLTGYQNTILRNFPEGSVLPRLGVVHPSRLNGDGWEPIQPEPSGDENVFAEPNKLFDRVRTERPPDRLDMLSLFNAITPTLAGSAATKVNVLVLVDESTSLTRAAINPAFELFKAEMLAVHGSRLEWHDPTAFNERWTNERWLGEAQLRLAQFLLN